MIFKLSLSSVEEKHSAKSSLPSVVFVTLGKEPFAECQKKTLGKETLCRVLKIKHSANSFFAECFLLPRVFCVALGK
jgi:precorrin-6x reductase